MQLCRCGCGVLVRHRWKRGHQFRAGRGNKQVDAAIVEAVAQVMVDEPAAPAEGPPPHPQPIDHRRWRLAVDRLSTPPTNPWKKTQCHECLKPMWTRDEQSTWEKGGLCVECDFLLRDRLSDYRKQQFGREVRTVIDPFRSR